MDTFTRLRRQALQKRDHAVKAARNEYTVTIARVNYLARALGGKAVESQKSAKAMADMICEVMPRDRLFTVFDVVDLLKEAYPDRSINTASVRSFFQSLLTQERLQRIRRANNRVLWAAPEYAEPTGDFGAKSLTEVLKAVLRERGPLTLIELVVAMQSRGYRAEDDPRLLMSAAGTRLRANPKLFSSGKAGRWSVQEK